MGNINTVLFQPPTPAVPVYSSRQFWLLTKRNIKIRALYLPRPGATVTLLYSHANAEDLGVIYSWLKCLSIRLNVNVMAYDYSGYGGNQATPSENKCYVDIEAAYDYLVSVMGTRPENIVLYGKSVGSGPSCYLASKTATEGRSVGGLILHCPFSSVYRIVLDFGFTAVGDKFPNIDRISSVRCPTFIVHGTNDGIVPIEHGKALYSALPEKCRAEPYWVEGRGHNDIEMDVDALTNRINRFLDRYALSRRHRFIQPTFRRCSTSEFSLVADVSLLQ